MCLRAPTITWHEELCPLKHIQTLKLSIIAGSGVHTQGSRQLLSPACSDILMEHLGVYRCCDDGGLLVLYSKLRWGS